MIRARVIRAGKGGLKNLVLTFIAIFIFGSLTAVNADTAEADKNHKNKKKVLKIESVSATGFNRLLGEPVMDLGKFAYLGFETVAAFNPEGDKPFPLTDETPGSQVLATYVDPAFLSYFMGGTSGPLLNPAHINLSLRDSVTNFFPTGVDYFTAPAVTEVSPEIMFQGAQSLPVTPVTLKDWLKAKGKVKFECGIDGRSTVKMKLKGLLPRRIYTVWAFFLTDEILPFADFGPIRALGGVSNAVVADAEGRGTYERVLNFCPMDLKGNEVPLGSVFVYFHSDQAIYGAVMSLPGEGRFPGAAGHVQLQFPVSARRVH